MKIRSVFDGGALKTEFEKIGIDPKFVPIIWKHLFLTLRNTNTEINSDCNWEWEKHVPSLPSSAYPLLRSNFKTPLSSTLHSVFHSSDNLTSKLLIKLNNGEFVEAVIMRYDTRLGKYGGKPRLGGLRATLCISSQVGCKMGCRFCATGSMGFKSNLSSGEIVEQLVHASSFAQIRNVVFMGMGEPLNNYSAVVESVRIMTGSPFQLSFKRITISTVGIIHAINKLHNDLPGLNLAASLPQHHRNPHIASTSSLRASTPHRLQSATCYAIVSSAIHPAFFPFPHHHHPHVPPFTSAAISFHVSPTPRINHLQPQTSDATSANLIENAASPHHDPSEVAAIKSAKVHS